MPAQATTIDIKKYLNVLRRRWMGSAALFLLVLAMGIVYCLLWPKVFEATALVVVQPQKVPKGIVASTVTTKVDERLQIITQKILSRTRLTELMDRFNLYPGSRGKVPPHALAERMRNDISIKISRRNYFTITFLYSEPKTTAAVANALAAFYVDANLRLREQDALGTARFLARELEVMRSQLREWEAKLTSFKESHLHELPGSVEKNVALLQSEQNRGMLLEGNLQNEYKMVSFTEGQIFTIQGKIEALELQKAHLRKIGASVSGGGGGGETDPEAIRGQIEQLRIKYTDNHPDIVRAKKHLEIAEAKKAAEDAQRRAQGLDTGEEEGEELSAETGSLEAQLGRAGQRVVDAKKRILALMDNKRQMAKNMSVLQARIDNAPKVQEKLDELMRGYSVLNKSYEKMHGQWLDANTAANLERTQRGEQFEVVDPAQVPDSPYRPNAAKALPVTLGIALILAIGLAFGMEFIDTSFTSVGQMERDSDLPVLVVVPPLITRKEALAKRRKLLVVGTLYSGIFLVMLVLIGLIYTGRESILKKLLFLDG